MCLLQAQLISSCLSRQSFWISYYHLNAEKKKLFLRNVLMNTLIKESITSELKTILISIHQFCFKQWRTICVVRGYPGSAALWTGLEFNMYFKTQIALSHGEVHVVMTGSKAVFCNHIFTTIIPKPLQNGGANNHWEMAGRKRHNFSFS